MTNILTAVGEINLWTDKEISGVKTDFNELQVRVSLTFSLLYQGKEYSIDKLKMYGVKDYLTVVEKIALIKSEIQNIDLRKKNKVRLSDKNGNLLQEINCDKWQYHQKKVLA